MGYHRVEGFKNWQANRKLFGIRLRLELTSEVGKLTLLPPTEGERKGPVSGVAQVGAARQRIPFSGRNRLRPHRYGMSKCLE